jgi:hypothetical protein
MNASATNKTSAARVATGQRRGPPPRARMTDAATVAARETAR